MQTNYIVNTIQVQPKTICSVRRRMSLRDFAEAFGTLCAMMQREKLEPSGPYCSIYHDEDFNPDNADIELAAEVSAQPGGAVRTFDPGLCCMAAHIGPYDDFSPCYAALMEWIAREGYTISGPSLEVYVKGCESGVSPEEYVTEIYIPISK